MAYTSALYSAGGVEYDIVAVDRTQEAIDSATQGIDSVGVHYSDTLTNIAFGFNMITMVAQTAFAALEEGYNQTVGVAIAYQDQIEYMHNTLGMTNEDAQKWKAAAVATDTDISAVTTSMKYLEQRISDTGTAGENLRSTLKSIGVDAKDANGQYKDASTLLQDILVGLNNIPAGAERAKAASEIFGTRNWANMAEMIENADTAVKKFHESNPTLTDEELAGIDVAKLKVAAFSEEFENTKVKAGAAVIDIGDNVINGMKIWDSALHLDLQGLQKTMKDMQDSEAAIRDAVRQSFEESLKSTGAGKGTMSPMGTWNGLEIGLITTGNNAATESTKNLYLGLSDADREIKYLSEVVIPKYEQALKDAEAAGTGVAEAQYTLANAIDHLNDLKTQDTDKTKAQVDAYKEYESQLKKVNDLQSQQQESDQEYEYEMGMAISGGDVSGARSLTIARTKEQMRRNNELGAAQATLSQDATKFNQIRAGVPLEQVAGTTQNTQAQALAAGDLKIEINVGQLSKDYSLTDLVTDAKTLRQVRIAMGGRVQGQ